MSTAENRTGGRVSLPESPHQPTPRDGPSREEIFALRGEYLIRAS